jgi:ABC-2 type transport system ATP-binding protein
VRRLKVGHPLDAKTEVGPLVHARHLEKVLSYAAIARQVKDLLRMRVAAGATVILTTHILDVAERMADRIGIIQHGRLLAEGSLAELQTTAGAGATLEDVFLNLVGG